MHGSKPGPGGRQGLDRALAGYDQAHERALADAIITAIVAQSMVDGTVVVRIGEIAAALVNILAMALALSPTATRTPAAIREVGEQVRKKIMCQVRQAERDPAVNDFLKRTINDNDRERGGRA
jgi:hypothetical protein